MNVKLRTALWRYGLAVGLFALILSLSATLSYLSFRINLAFLIAIGIVAATWYGGKGPGILFATLIQATIIITTANPIGSSPTSIAIGHFSVFLLLIFVVLLTSSRKKVEKGLREQQELLQVMLSSIGDAVIATDIDGRINFINPTAEALTGWTMKKAARQPLDEVFNIFDATTRQPLETPLEKVLQEGIIVGLANDTVLAASDGREIPIEDSCAPIRDLDGKIIGVIIVFQDVTERKSFEKAQQESQQKYESLVQSIEGIVWEIDAQTHNFTFVSRQAEKILGYPLEQWTGEQNFWANHLHPDDRERAMNLCTEAIEKKGDNQFDYRMIADDGHAIWFRDIITVEAKADGSVRARGVMVDITTTKKLEEQLLLSQKMESVGRLAGGIAHDFNNMLTAINGYSNLTLRRLKKDDPLRRNIEEIKKAGDRSALLTQQLLAFSRQQILMPEVVDVNTVIGETNNLLQRLIGEDIELSTVFKQDVGFVKVDPGQLSQIIINLAVNARDAMPQGGKLTIETRNIFLDPDYARQHIEVLPGDYVMLSVSDTGTGMDDETRQHIFEPFFTTKEIGKGTGLGLSMVYGIIKQSNGNIMVYSEVGHGTTFKIYLPRVTGQTEESEVRDTADEMANGTETILLVEDEAIVRKLSREVLESCGYTVIEAENGIEALAVCEKQDIKIDLLMTDVVMPQMGGRELAEKLIQKHGQIRILFTSGYTDDAVVRHGVIEANTNFIQKPFTPYELEKKVREILDTHIK